MMPVNMGANFGKFVNWGRFFGGDFEFQEFGVYLLPKVNRRFTDRRSIISEFSPEGLICVGLGGKLKEVYYYVNY
jgi:hypothetical protein